MVDKINCIGRVFLEPEHHYYKPKHSYEFEYEGEIEITKKNLKKYKYHKLKGKYDFIALLSTSSNNIQIDKKSKNVFEIEKISKAKIYLKGKD